LDLIEQTVGEFSSVGISAVQVARTKDELRTMLSQDARGVIVTTIFRFKDAGELNDRTNVVVMVDEAHRTQEGRLGLDMRAALPNAKFIGLTGTPISTDDRNTWAMFGDPDDPDGALNHYSVERSIFDGATLPVHVETRLVDFHFDAEAMQRDFDELAEDEGLDDEQQAFLTRKASHLSIVVRDEDRVEAVCRDIVTHYRERIAPLGLKAQIVAYDRATCVAYHEQITKLLAAGEEATVVMTTAKDDPQDWAQWDRDRDEEAVIKDRFRDIDDPLKFLIVTAKLLTGFDAPIEGVMYLDKPLRAHTLFQAVCRTNRRWTNPRTGQEKLHGLVVDYVGMGEELAKAVAVKPGPNREGPSEGDIDTLFAELVDAISTTHQRFDSIDRTQTSFEQVFEAQNILATEADREEFATEFIRCQGLFEFLYPDLRLKPHEDDYRFLAKVYASITPSNAANMLLWHRLGAKTMAIVHEHLTDVTIDGGSLDQVALDAETLEYLQDNQLVLIPTPDTPRPPPTAGEVLERLEERIRRRIEGGDVHRVWRSLTERLEELRAAKLATAEASVEFLKHLMELARDLVRAERADDDGHLNDIKVLDPRTGALTQIFNEYAPAERAVIVDEVVEAVDELVAPVRGSGWQTSRPQDQEVRRQLRITLRRFSLPVKGGLFDDAYAYIRENY
jgi:type I restriction enzyme R subunit